MKKIIISLIGLLALTCSLSAFDTSNIVGCDTLKVSHFVTPIQGADSSKVNTPAEIILSQAEKQYDQVQAYLDSHIIGPEHYALIVDHEALGKALTAVDICIINRGTGYHIKMPGIGGA